MLILYYPQQSITQFYYFLTQFQRILLGEVLLIVNFLLNYKVSLRYENSPTAISPALNIPFQNKLVEKLLNSSNTDASYLFHICQCKRWLCTHGIQYLRVS